MTAVSTSSAYHDRPTPLSAANANFVIDAPAFQVVLNIWQNKINPLEGR